MRLPRFFKENKKATIAIALLGVTLVALCQMAFAAWFRSTYLNEEGYKRVSTKLIAPRKEKSLEKWQSRRIGDESAAQFALARTSLVVTCEFPLSISPPPSDNEPDQSPGESDSKSEEKDRPNINSGTATAITSDGYWLTAAHVVDFAYIYLAPLKGGPPSPDRIEADALHPVRIVWTGAVDDPSVPDLALIYCSHLPAQHFPLLRPPLLSADAEVLTSGFGGGKPGQSAGKILLRGGNKGSKSGPRWMVYLNDAPVIPGDSGGPLLTAGGQLLGINSSGHFSLSGFLGWLFIDDYRARTICPDTDWIRKLILADRVESKRKSESDSQSDKVPVHPPAVSVVANQLPFCMTTDGGNGTMRRISSRPTSAHTVAPSNTAPGAPSHLASVPLSKLPTELMPRKLSE